jgi:hypothetical protein
LTFTNANHTPQAIQIAHKINPFLVIKNKQIFISSEGFSALEKKWHVMFSEGNAAQPVGCDSPLQIIKAVWDTFIKI